MTSELKRRLGAKLLIEREQVKQWSRIEAAKKAGFDSGVIKRIELGLNYKVDALEAYAQVLGTSIDDLLWTVLAETRATTQETQRAAGAVAAGHRFPATPPGHSRDRRAVNSGPPPGVQERRAR